jgi:predicted NodU family carbamoyl transferase
MNGKILLNTPFRRVYVQPAAGDSGTALGVC